ncbi:MAG: DUF3990 domain-containing protein [Bacteroidales bacterium]|jgi:hypothetical protein|nr:DUF3990 domain-containing protein [Bacteroidales bacterium]
MKVYHGSDTIVSVIDLQKCKPNRDFGRGFYVTRLRSQAEDMAIRVARYSKKKTVVTEYEFDEYAYEDDEMKVLRFEKYDEEWLDFVILNRNTDKRKQAHDYDIVEGPVADDKITRNIAKYLKGKYSKEEFLEMLKYSEPNHQICFCSVNSLQMLEYTDKHIDLDSAISDIGEQIIKQIMLDGQIDERKATDLFYSSKIFAELSSIENKLHEKGWMEIYELLLDELKVVD